MSNGYIFGDIQEAFPLYFISQNVLNGTSLLHTNNSFIGMAYGLYNALSDELTLYDLVTDIPVGQIHNYGLRFSYFRVKKSSYILPNIFTRFYFNQGNNYLLSRNWIHSSYIIPSCAEFLYTLSLPMVTLSYLIYNGYILPSEDVRDAYINGSIEGHPSINNFDFKVSFSYSIPQYGYPSCRTSVLALHYSRPEGFNYPRLESEAVITQSTQWYAPLILSDIGVYAIGGSNFYFAKIGGIYSPYAVCLYINAIDLKTYAYAFIHIYYFPLGGFNTIAYPSRMAIGLPYEFKSSLIYMTSSLYSKHTTTTESLWNYTPPYLRVNFLVTRADYALQHDDNFSSPYSVYPLDYSYVSGSTIIL